MTPRDELKEAIIAVLDAHPNVRRAEKKEVLRQLRAELLKDFICVAAGCELRATHLVWYAQAGGLYTYLCLQHLADHIKSQDASETISSVRAIEDAI